MSNGGMTGLAYRVPTGSAPCKAVLAWMAAFADGEHSVAPTVARLSEDLDLSERAVQAALKRLRTLDLVAVRRESAAAAPRIYSLNVQQMLATASPCVRDSDDAVYRSGRPRNRGKPRKAIGSIVIRAVWRRDEGRCVYCGATSDLQLDHVLPWSRGGKNTTDNLALACATCNQAKGDRTPEEWLA